MFELRRVAYAFNSQLDTPYFLDCLVQRGDQLLVDVHKQFKTSGEFFTAMEGILPLLEDKEVTEDADKDPSSETFGESTQNG